MPSVIDCDIHNTVPSVEALVPYLSDHWREYVRQSAFRGPSDTAYPPGAPTSAIPGSRPPEGGPPGSSLELIRLQVLDPWDVDAGILTCAYAVDSIHNPDCAAAMASATNDWQIAEWLDREPRLRASLVVPVQQPLLAAREIDRLMFATDYPHWDFDAPDTALVTPVDRELEAAIMAGNAKKLYGLE